MQLTDEHKMIRKMVREFAEAEVKPVAQQIDETCEFPWETVKKMGELGLLGMPFPEELGGGGGDTLGYTIGVEEVSRVCGSTGITMAAHTSLGCYPIFDSGTEEQKKKYLPDIASGRKLAGFGLTEPNAGSDAGATETTAVRDGDHYVLNGTKCFITNASTAETFVVTTMTDREKGTSGISAFILEKGMPGFKPGKKESKLGVCGSDTGELIFEDCRVPAENLLGKAGEGFKVFLRTLDGGRISIGAMALGIAQGALDYAISYTKERTQFGKPIFSFQGLQWMMADMATQVEAARQLTYKAAAMFEKVPKNLDRLSKDMIRASAMAKLYAADTAMKVTIDAVQLL